MDLNFNSKLEEYYQKFIELQEKLKRSEEQRFMLEMKFNEMAKIAKEEEQVHYRKLRAQYKRFLEEDQKRHERNERIIRNLERIEMRISMLSAKTDRINMFRRQYQNYLRRIANSDNIGKTPIIRERSFIKEEPLEEQQHASFRDDYSLPERPKNIFDQKKHMFEHPAFKRALEKDRSNEEKIDILDRYLQSISSQRCHDTLNGERGAREKLASDMSSERFFKDDFSSRASNHAAAAADDIMKSIYSRYYTKADDSPKATKTISQKNTHNDNKDSYTMGNLGYTVETKNLEDNTYLNPPLSKNSEDFKQKIPDVTFEREFNIGNNHSDINNENKDRSNEMMIEHSHDNTDTHSGEHKEETISPRSIEFIDKISTSITNENDKKNIEEEHMKTTDINHGLLQKPEPLDSVYPLVENENIQEIESLKAKEINYKTPVDDKINEVICLDIQPNENGDKVTFDPILQVEASTLSTDTSEAKNEDNFRNKSDIQHGEIQTNDDLIGIKNKGAVKLEQTFNDQGIDQNEPQNEKMQFGLDHQNKNADHTLQNYESVEQPKSQDQSDFENQESEGLPANYIIPDSENQPLMQIQKNEEQAQLQGSEQPQQYYRNEFYTENQQNENGQIMQSQQAQHNNGNSEQPIQYDETGQHIDYPQNGPSYQEIQYNEHGQPIQYDQNNQPIAYDENGQPTQYDENSQPIGYDQYGQPLLYDQHGQIVQPQYDESGQIIPQYDQNGQLIILYDQNGQQVFHDQQQYDSNGQPIMQYDENGQPIYDQSQQQYYDYNNQEQAEQSQLYNQYQAHEGQYVEPEVQQIQDSGDHQNSQEPQDKTSNPDLYQDEVGNQELDTLVNIVEPQIEKSENQASDEKSSSEVVNQVIAETVENNIKGAETVDEDHDADKHMVEKPANVMDILDTDTESTKQNTSKTSNGSDFDFS